MRSINGPLFNEAPASDANPKTREAIVPEIPSSVWFWVDTHGKRRVRLSRPPGTDPGIRLVIEKAIGPNERMKRKKRK